MRSRPDCLKKIVFQNLRYLTVSTLAFVCKSIENRDVGLCIEKWNNNWFSRIFIKRVKYEIKIDLVIFAFYLL